MNLSSLVRLIAASTVIAWIANTAPAQVVTDFVDPFIGTAGGGNTFPGAVLPWGMVSVSPHTSPGAPCGYIQGQNMFYGFGHTHLSGTGCADFGSIVLRPRRGPILDALARPGIKFGREEARPGYYRIELEEINADAELTATVRCGLTQFTSTSVDTLNVIVDVGTSLGVTGGGYLRFVSDREMVGFNIGGGICGEANRHRTYFVARINVQPLSHGIYREEAVDLGPSVQAEGEPVGGWIRVAMKPGEPLRIKVGVSYVSIENARMNLDQELPDWDFDRVRSQADSAWAEQLSRIRVKGGSRTDSVKFYTALYHALIHPSIASDVNGEYVRMGRSGTGTSGDEVRYSVYSLWDTYRTLHPLLTLVYPEVQLGMIRTMIDMYRESGWLPKWELAGNETYLMVGDPAAIVIADSYMKGLRDFDVVAAMKAIRKASVAGPQGEAPLIRPGYHDLLRLGYIPVDQDTTQEWWVWGPVSTMLEYCLADWAAGKMFQEGGDSRFGGELVNRSKYYRNVFDSATAFMRPKRSDGTWLVPFDPLESEGSGSWSGSGGPGYVEGTAWNYSWFVPHDVPGLMGLFGGPEAFAGKLKDGFSKGRFTMSNEPDIGNPYVFRMIPGHEHEAERILSRILHSDFTAGPTGLPGNDDAGAISAWYVFSAMGFYPFCPGSGNYVVGLPVFDRVSISLSPPFSKGGELVIEKVVMKEKGSSSSVMFDGQPLTGYIAPHEELVRGGKLTIAVPWRQ